MAAPKLNGKHGELITKMYAKVGVLGNDMVNIKDSQKDLKKEVSKIHESITDLKVNTKGYAEKLKAVSDDLDEHKDEHRRLTSRILTIVGIITTVISMAVAAVIEFFKK